jgi:hypothetical protein
MCSFRYVDDVSSSCVTLTLFRTLNGTARASVLGPRTSALPWTSMSEHITCVPSEEAFAPAIRMANRFDVELVVSGDTTLWRPEWGQLSMHVPPTQIDRMLGLPADILGTHDESSSYSA